MNTRVVCDLNINHHPRPLPDERPRASVANLINRFEHHTKRQSIVPSVPSGSSILLEAPKRDSTEKLELSPKSTTSPDPLPSADDTSVSAAPQQLDEPTADQPAPVSPNLPNHKSSLPKSSSASTRNTTKSTAARPTPRSSQTSSATPLKPQHTGQSTTSNSSSTRKPAVPRTAPSTPSKTPRTSVSVTSPPRAKTPSRPKTPSSTSRPKTPSSLFSPTAASLAKSRSAPTQPPPHTKKSTANSASADRLSKPTAASLSRARTPSSTPTRGASTTRGGSTRGAKPKTASAPSNKPKLPPATSPHVPQVQDVGEESISHHQGHLNGNDNALHLEHSSDADVEEPQAVDNDTQAPTSPVSETHSTSITGDEDDNGDTTPIAERFSHVQLPGDVDDAKQPLVQDTSSSKSEATNDLEDIVNLLESARSRPVSIVSIPDEVNEIPDEE
ncbi:hypothetical protein D9758_003814 [Tetrapyrgos nigripes]|uniref:Uncharacterized protein n=1 Tax=Tetrapyrgos nigripes TaxID=182062 RepID=A0A8H5LS58_9AGAR|nr:hypothetical protein D9758_003814 [Tetrapyrgos nigripes]